MILENKLNITDQSEQENKKELLKQSLTDKINDGELYMKGIDNSYLYEGYLSFKTDEL